MKSIKPLILAITISCLSFVEASHFFNATSNVETGLNFGTEWYDGTGQIRAWSYFQVVSEPWEGGRKAYQWGAGRADGFWSFNSVEIGTLPVEFQWPVTLLSVPGIDPSWTTVTVDCVWAYDFPDYIAGPVYLCGYTGGDVWVDAQGGAILEAFGDQPEWWSDPFAALRKTNRGKHLGHAK